jgi:hypothetical protein
MEIIPGGIRNIIFADNVNFTDYTEIKSILKRGTSIVPGTIAEEFGNDESFGALKKTELDITSADYDSVKYTLLEAAEAARTPLYFRIFTMHPHYYLDLFAVEIYCDRQLNELGKFNAITISGMNEGPVESNILNLVYMFNPFNPENL